MPANDGKMMICTTKEAETYGFCIEGPICFIWDLPVGAICLGYNTLDKVWQADLSMATDDDVYQMVHDNVHHIMKVCDNVSTVSRMGCEISKVLELFDFELC